jgi:hypothetical protein
MFKRISYLILLSGLTAISAIAAKPSFPNSDILTRLEKEKDKYTLSFDSIVHGPYYFKIYKYRPINNKFLIHVIVWKCSEFMNTPHDGYRIEEPQYIGDVSATDSIYIPTIQPFKNLFLVGISGKTDERLWLIGLGKRIQYDGPDDSFQSIPGSRFAVSKDSIQLYVKSIKEKDIYRYNVNLRTLIKLRKLDTKEELHFHPITNDELIK